VVGNKCNENKIGPRMNPCGTPLSMGAGCECASPIFTEKDLFKRKDLNHASAVPQIPTSFSRRVNKISWSMVSNAALRSNKTRTAEDPESNRSFETLIKADSVLW